MLLFGRDVTTWQSHRRTALGMARTFQITSLFPRLTVLDNVLLAIKGLRPSKFVMWRFLSSYREVYDKAHQLLEQAASWIARTPRFATFLTANNASSRSCWGSRATRSILLLDEPAAGLSSGESRRDDEVPDEA